MFSTVNYLLRLQHIRRTIVRVRLHVCLKLWRSTNTRLTLQKHPPKVQSITQKCTAFRFKRIHSVSFQKLLFISCKNHFLLDTYGVIKASTPMGFDNMK